MEPDRPHMTIRRMRFACWVSKAIRAYSLAHTNAPVYPIPPQTHTHTHTHTHTKYIVLPFPQQQWLSERTSLLCYTYTAYLIRFSRFQVFTRCWFFIVYRRFGTAYRNHHQGSESNNNVLLLDCLIYKDETNTLSRNVGKLQNAV